MTTIKKTDIFKKTSDIFYHTMRYCFFLLILVLFSGCYTNYKVLNSGNGVRSNIPIKTTFQVSKIDSILRFDEWEIPNDFVIGKTYN